MADLSEESKKLYSELARRGYDRNFCGLIAMQLNTSWTAGRMLGYLRQVPVLNDTDIVDEMLAILSDRDRIRQKKEMEYYQGKLNELYRYGLDSDEED